MSDKSPTVRLLPFQIVQQDETIYVRRGSVQIVFEGEEILDVLARLQELATTQAIGRDELLSHFPPLLHDRVDGIVRHLVSRELAEIGRGDSMPDVAHSDETGEDIFFWQLGTSRSEVAGKTDVAIALVGVNRLSLQLHERLRQYGSWKVTLVDDVPLRNHALVESEPELIENAVAADAFEAAVSGSDLVVACAEFGGIGLLKPWNALCMKREVPFLPIVLEDASIRIGPLSVVDETACLACLEARENAVLKERVAERRLMETAAAKGQAFASAHPAVLDIAATLAAFEVLRFSAEIYPMRVGKRLDFNIMSSSMVASRVLKAPRCPACSPLRHAGQLSLEKPQLDPLKWAKVEAMGGSHDGH